MNYTVTVENYPSFLVEISNQLNTYKTIQVDVSVQELKLEDTKEFQDDVETVTMRKKNNPWRSEITRSELLQNASKWDEFVTLPNKNVTA